MFADLTASLIVRAIITLALIGAVIYQVVVAGDVNQILAGLAGIAVGYWLGKETSETITRALGK